MTIDSPAVPPACAVVPSEPSDDGELRRLIESAADTLARARWATAVFMQSYDSFAFYVSGADEDRHPARAALREAYATVRSEPRPLPSVFLAARANAGSLSLVCGALPTGVAIATFSRSNGAAAELFTKADAATLLGFATDQSAAFERAIRSACERFALAIARRRVRPSIVVLDRSLRVVGSSLASDVVVGRDSARPVVDEGVLDAAVRHVVERMRAELGNSSVGGDATTLAICGSLLLRLHRLSGKTGYVLCAEPFRERDYLASAVERFGFSAREIEVLTRLLDGHPVARIAADLFLAPSTVEYHLRHLFEKTDARHRSNLVARVLGWPEVGDRDSDDDATHR